MSIDSASSSSSSGPSICAATTFRPIAAKYLSLRKSALDEVQELTDLYLTLRDEIERRIDRESETGAWDPAVGKLLLLAGNVLTSRAALRHALGIGDAES
jgi:hypothetical protein